MFEEEEMWILWQLNYHSESTKKVTVIPERFRGDPAPGSVVTLDTRYKAPVQYLSKKDVCSSSTI